MVLECLLLLQCYQSSKSPSCAGLGLETILQWKLADRYLIIMALDHVLPFAGSFCYLKFLSHDVHHPFSLIPQLITWVNTDGGKRSTLALFQILEKLLHLEAPACVFLISVPLRYAMYISWRIFHTTIILFSPISFLTPRQYIKYSGYF